MDRIHSLIREFALACDAAKNNVELMDKYPTLGTCIAVRRMDRIAKAENALLCDIIVSLVNGETEDIPQVALDYEKADCDRGCPDCWCSALGLGHAECTEKIERWFKCRNALVEYGLSLV